MEKILQYSETSEKRNVKNEICDIFLTGDYLMQNANITECFYMRILQCQHAVCSSHLSIKFNFNQISVFRFTRLHCISLSTLDKSVSEERLHEPGRYVYRPCVHKKCIYTRVGIRNLLFHKA